MTQTDHVDERVEIDRLYAAGYAQGKQDYPEVKMYVAYEEWQAGYRAGQEDAQGETDD